MAVSIPINRGNRCDPPAPGIGPTLTSGKPNLVLASAIRQAQAIAGSNPPPSTVPGSAATTGALFSKICTTSGNSGCSGVRSNSDMSPPATKVLPAQIRMAMRDDWAYENYHRDGDGWALGHVPIKGIPTSFVL